MFNPDFYPTPPDVAATMLDQIEAHMSFQGRSTFAKVLARR